MGNSGSAVVCATGRNVLATGRAAFADIHVGESGAWRMTKPKKPSRGVRSPHSVSVTAAAYARLRKVAKQRGMSLNALIAEALDVVAVPQ